ncbi:hypothetical protein SAMN02799630_04856 [Paenibacillus sp. UNCCL117]|uniref:hypothetical protein n=1 Tax=unclassified Paenibacillus TaxID=185978 RepID=UPI0008807413|nr:MULTISPECIES: hypothetical protein [unclassified Paenibacillus]SDE15947.1 hypothetical protein SAMN04488602_12074 [Paenibacillus sp. cl123]SFW61033.1 hypothetical protein SAMN02799630_04856 [Paenibacillus sp. UNCCL117]
MIAPVGSLFRAYETHALWAAQDKAQQSRSGPVSRITKAVFPDSTMAGYRFDQFAKEAAAGLAQVEDKAGQAKQTAADARDALRSVGDKSGLAAEQLTRGYNELVTALSEAGPMTRSAASRFAAQLPLGQLEELGLERQPDGTLSLHAAKFAEQSARRPAEAAQALAGFAERLMTAASELQTSPAFQLLEPKYGPLRALSSYGKSPGSGLKTYLPVPITGILFDAYM